MPADFMLYLWEGIIANERMITILFTLLVLGAVCFGLSVLPQWQAQEMARAREQEAARAMKPTPVEELRKAA